MSCGRLTGDYTVSNPTCTEINECLSAACGVNAVCTNTIGAFTCGCAPGYDASWISATSPIVAPNTCTACNAGMMKKAASRMLIKPVAADMNTAVRSHSGWYRPEVCIWAILW